MKHSVIWFESTQFSYNPTTRTLSADASDLENRHLQQLDDYNDSNRGFVIKFCGDGGSNDITFVMSHTELFPDNDGIAYWSYIPTKESMINHPQYKDVKVIVFND
jgi:hypothetical protein